MRKQSNVEGKIKIKMENEEAESNVEEKVKKSGKKRK